MKRTSLLGQSHRRYTMLVLTGILSAGFNLVPLSGAIAAGTAQERAIAPTAVAQAVQEGQLPRPVLRGLRRDLSQRTGIAPGKLKVVEATPRTWSNGCLGLAQRDEMCTQMMVSGWRVVFSDGQRRWVYRTDESGRTYRLETQSQTTQRLPNTVRTAALREAAQDTDLEVEQLTIRQFEPIEANSCLNLPEPGEACAEYAQRAWKVWVQADQQQLVYHVSRDGQQVRLNRSESEWDGEVAIQPTRIPSNELPPRLRQDELFRVIQSGGFAGQTYQTTLMRDGRLIRMRIGGDAIAEMPSVRRISQQQLREFQQAINRYSLQPFDRANYPAARGSADYFTMTLCGRSGTVRYADSIRNQLPRELQAIVQSWERLTNS